MLQLYRIVWTNDYRHFNAVAVSETAEGRTAQTVLGYFDNPRAALAEINRLITERDGKPPRKAALESQEQFIQSLERLASARCRHNEGVYDGRCRICGARFR